MPEDRFYYQRYKAELPKQAFMSMLEMFWKRKKCLSKSVHSLGSHRQSVICCALVGSSLDDHRRNSHTAGLCLKTSDTTRQLILRQ